MNEIDLVVYLNKWNYSIFFMHEREPFPGLKWHLMTPSNVHFCSDYSVPFTACHHQKLIVVDDEIAFCGGMDIALGRWDKRQHRLEVRERVDPGGVLAPLNEVGDRQGGDAASDEQREGEPAAQGGSGGQ